VPSPGISRIDHLVSAFERALLLLAALVPAAGTYYLRAFGSGAQIFMNHPMHEIAIGVSLVCSGFVAYVALRCYQASGDRFVHWLALALIAETLIYAPHGIFTRLSHDHMALFLIYGPMSRLVMAVLLLIGLVQYDLSPHERERIARGGWGRAIAVFCGIDLVLGVVSLQFVEAIPILRLVLEYSALATTAAAVMLILLRPKASPLMRLYTFSLIGFATSSVTFIFTTPWTHLWWYAHAVFAAAFLLLSYGVLQAFRSTGAFSGVFSQQQMMEYLRKAKQQADEANVQLQAVNARLEVLATTDALTGAANRRHFMDRAQHELVRARRANGPLSVLLIDLDHFKAINDRFGHAEGDRVLKTTAAEAVGLFREGDLVGRIGGEEFAILLPDTGHEAAVVAAERLRATLRALDLGTADGDVIALSISVGVASLGADGDDVAALLRTADRRLYAAKHAGRDCVVHAG
jgi:two-component system cell cycle response regulator